jgi:acetyl-CoA carboxylase carboxyl transferase subunit beta
MAWWSRKNKATELGSEKRSVPTGLFQKCDGCGAAIDSQKLRACLRCCPLCGHHFAMPTAERIELLLDEGSAVEVDAGLAAEDPLGFKDTKRYADRLRTLEKATGQPDAFRAFLGSIGGVRVSFGVFQFEFMGGSMGSVVGEKIARLFERAASERVPAVILSASGGARMQEGILSLMQMAKTSAALGRLRDLGMPYISVLLHPTTGGVAASFAMLGDLILAEPKAMIGFAGPRVIEQTIRQKLPEGFQRAEFLLQHGMIDAIVPRPELKARLAHLLRLLLGMPADHSARSEEAEGEGGERAALSSGLGGAPVAAPLPGPKGPIRDGMLPVEVGPLSLPEIESAGDDDSDGELPPEPDEPDEHDGPDGRDPTQGDAHEAADGGSAGDREPPAGS